MGVSKKPDIVRLLEFQRLLLAFSQVDRGVHQKHGEMFRPENDTEHSYNLALTAWFLADYFPKLNKDTIIRYALVHDLVEIHAGDTYVYGSPEELRSKQSREDKALQKLQADWADFPSLIDDITAYEQKDSEEANFVYALDKVMPTMLVYINNGYTWKREGINLEMLDAVKRHKVSASPEINDYYAQLYALLLDNQHLFGKE